MLTTLWLVLPVFGVIFCGYGVARTPLLTEAGVSGLNAFVNWVAIPALLFHTLSRGVVPDGADLGIVQAYFGASFLLFGLSWLLGRLAFRVKPEEAAIFAMGTVFSNTVMLGIPLVYTAFGERGLAEVLLIVAFHSTLLIPLTTLALEMGRGGRAGFARLLPATLGNLARNPIILSMAGGILWSLTGWALPGPFDRFLGLLSQGATPAALFAVGASLARYRIAGNLAEAGTMVAIKLVLHPLAVWLACTQVFALPPLDSAVATTVACVPVGITVFVLGTSLGVYVRRAATAVLVSTAIGVASTGVVLALVAP